mmetsp:Transcript_29985/g.60866  ORF Transcript_29985/g.60866 Transcript_29985/m.60866 type:complete len:168 (-) Transcript_29985:2347-2850(-)
MVGNVGAATCKVVVVPKYKYKRGRKRVLQTSTTDAADDLTTNAANDADITEDGHSYDEDYDPEDLPKEVSASTIRYSGISIQLISDTALPRLTPSPTPEPTYGKGGSRSGGSTSSGGSTRAGVVGELLEVPSHTPVAAPAPGGRRTDNVEEDKDTVGGKSDAPLGDD